MQKWGIAPILFAYRTANVRMLKIVRLIFQCQHVFWKGLSTCQWVRFGANVSPECACAKVQLLCGDNVKWHGLLEKHGIDWPDKPLCSWSKLFPVKLNCYLFPSPTYLLKSCALDTIPLFYLYLILYFFLNHLKKNLLLSSLPPFPPPYLLLYLFLGCWGRIPIRP